MMDHLMEEPNKPKGLLAFMSILILVVFALSFVILELSSSL